MASHITRDAMLYDYNGDPIDIANPLPVDVIGPVDVDVLTLPGNPAQDGTDGNGIVAPAGGVGIRGWLSGIFQVLSDVWVSASHYLKVQVQNASIAVTGTFWQATQPVSLAAATPYSFIAAGGANQDSTVVKNAPGVLHSFSAINLVATVRHLKLYDKATGPTSADTPILRYPIPANSTTGAGFVVTLPKGYNFANGISFRITTGIADNDANAATAGDCVINLGYV